MLILKIVVSFQRHVMDVDVVVPIVVGEYFHTLPVKHTKKKFLIIGS